ncbi:MAG: adenylate/guanylate cyclase domain-containing protein [Actinobacteria bacterium]|nr:adenylate/guanylate cyclase domain-containing protein [Actinomycetota bacterium]
MRALPSGTVTFVFTDIEGSTALLKRLGGGYGEVLAAHRRIVRETFERADGIEIDTQGDAFFFAFPRARDAVAAAVEAQRAHAAHAWPEDSAVRVRMGLHTGEPSVVEEGYLGLDVVRAARICTAARGGNVLLSGSTRALLGSTLPDGVSVFPRGERHLKTSPSASTSWRSRAWRATSSMRRRRSPFRRRRRRHRLHPPQPSALGGPGSTPNSEQTLPRASRSASSAPSSGVSASTPPRRRRRQRRTRTSKALPRDPPRSKSRSSRASKLRSRPRGSRGTRADPDRARYLSAWNDPHDVRQADVLDAGRDPPATLARELHRAPPTADLLSARRNCVSPAHREHPQRRRRGVEALAVYDERVRESPVREPAELLEEPVVVSPRVQDPRRRKRRREKTVAVRAFPRNGTRLRRRGQADTESHPAAIPGDSRDGLYEERSTEAVLRAPRTPRGERVGPGVEWRKGERQDPCELRSGMIRPMKWSRGSKRDSTAPATPLGTR